MSQDVSVMFMAEALESSLLESDLDPWFAIMESPVSDLETAKFHAHQYGKHYTCKTRVMKITCEVLQEFNGMH